MTDEKETPLDPEEDPRVDIVTAALNEAQAIFERYDLAGCVVVAYLGLMAGETQFGHSQSVMIDGKELKFRAKPGEGESTQDYTRALMNTHREMIAMADGLITGLETAQSAAQALLDHIGAAAGIEDTRAPERRLIVPRGGGRPH